MIEITPDSAAIYLLSSGRIHAGDPVEVCELAGGVSNVVLLVTLPERGERFVLKQARGRLRVKEEWLCSVERIWREVEVLRICSELLEARNAEPTRKASAPAGNERPFESTMSLESTVPQVLWEDRQNYLYSMTAAPEGHRTWKELLLGGEVDLRIAIACGRLLGTLHAGSWGDQAIAERLNDRSYFDQLRLDPYYRQIARVHPDLAPAVQRLIDSVWQNRCALIHGDFSPKNLLVWPGHVMLIDFEVGHYGDPAFDLGFFLTHLVLKAVWSGNRRREYLTLARTFWEEYAKVIQREIPPEELARLEERMLWNLSGCLLARVDGKSPVDYLSAGQQESVRGLAREWLVGPPTTIGAALESVGTTW